jgi:hypothetical protein
LLVIVFEYKHLREKLEPPEKPIIIPEQQFKHIVTIKVATIPCDIASLYPFKIQEEIIQEELVMKLIQEMRKKNILDIKVINIGSTKVYETVIDIVVPKEKLNINNTLQALKLKRS